MPSKCRAVFSKIESFDYTEDPRRDAPQRLPAARICARLLGTEFSVLDLLAYAVGVVCIAAVDRAQSHSGGRAAQQPQHL